MSQKIHLFEDVIFISEMSLDVKVRFVWPSTIPHMTRSRITEASIGFYGTDCCKYFTSKTVSFTASESEFNVNSQELFWNRAQRIIDALSYVPPSIIQPESNFESPDDSKSVDSYNGLKRQIAVSFQRTSQAFCWTLSRIAAKASSSLRIFTDAVQDLILFFYAKPMKMNIEYGKERKHIMICPLEGTWDYLQNALAEELWNLNEIPMKSNDQILNYYGNFNLKLKGDHGTTINITSSKWKNTRWNEQVDVFIVEGSIKRRNEKEMDLLVAAHRGHYSRQCLPKRLLEGSKHTAYVSKDGSPSKDWIIFRQRKQCSFYPTKLMFMNRPYKSAIKTVVLLWSDNGKKYHEWTRIGFIKKHDGEQWFNLNEKEIAAAGGKLQYIKLKIVNNYGGSSNGFRRFSVSGFCVSLDLKGHVNGLGK